MADLFGYSKTNNELTFENASRINGLRIIIDFISPQEEKFLLECIDKRPWLADLKRRVQHYGYKYDYRARRIDKSNFIGEIPDWMDFLRDRLVENKIIDFLPDQAIINEYILDQGISSHIDCEPCFGDTIISLSLGGFCILNFQKSADTMETEKIPLLLSPRTLIVMTGEARYNWYHGIPERKADKFNGNMYKRNRRISITFRKVIEVIK